MGTACLGKTLTNHFYIKKKKHLKNYVDMFFANIYLNGCGLGPSLTSLSLTYQFICPWTCHPLSFPSWHVSALAWVLSGLVRSGGSDCKNKQKDCYGNDDKLNETLKSCQGTP